MSWYFSEKSWTIRLGRKLGEAVKKANLIENICKIAFKTLEINDKSKISKNLILKHFLRKHGKKAYYGQ